MLVSAERSFWSKVCFDGPVPVKRPDLGPCWLWLRATKNNGYGSYRSVLAFGPAKTYIAHRFAYLYVFDELPDGEADHLCERRICVNPFHLEFVSHRVNVLRGNTIVARAAAATHCPQGHAYDAFNTHIKVGGGRGCRACDRERARTKRRLRVGHVRCVDCGCVVGTGPRCRSCGGVLREARKLAAA